MPATSPTLYAFTPADASIPLWDLSDKQPGVVIRAHGTALQKHSSAIDWGQIDNDIAAARKAGKSVILEFLWGFQTPSFVQCKRYGATFNKESGQLPVIWDAAYLSAFEAFIAAAGARYNSDPSVVAVHITGTGVRSAEYHLAPELQKQAGYSPAELLATRQTCTAAFNAAFPSKALISDVSIVFTGQNDGLREKFAAQDALLGPSRVWFQMDHLQVGTPANEPDSLTVSKYGSLGHKTGYEMAQPANSQAELNKIIDMMAQRGADYGQIYQTQAVGVK